MRLVRLELTKDPHTAKTEYKVLFLNPNRILSVEEDPLGGCILAIGDTYYTEACHSKLSTRWVANLISAALSEID